MTKTLRKGDADRATTLQALRAGPMTAMEMAERWSFGSAYAKMLCSAGLVEVVGDEYRLTPAGRAACPCRNPLAATAATPPEIFTMPKGETHVTRQQVLAVILAAGPSGATRKELIEKFASRATEQAIDMHLTALNRQQPPAIYKPRPGLFIDIRLKPAGAATETAEIAPETASTATDETQAEVDIHGVPLTVDHHDVADLSAEHLEQQMAQIGNLLPHLDELEVKAVPGGVREHMEKYAGRLPSFVPVVEDILLSDPEDVEFCVYSSGTLDIFTDECAITLKPPVLAKLRGFLGLFQEAA